MKYISLVDSACQAGMSWNITWGLIHRAGVPIGDSSRYYELWCLLTYGAWPAPL